MFGRAVRCTNETEDVRKRWQMSEWDGKYTNEREDERKVRKMSESMLKNVKNDPFDSYYYILGWFIIFLDKNIRWEASTAFYTKIYLRMLIVNCIIEGLLYIKLLSKIWICKCVRVMWLVINKLSVNRFFSRCIFLSIYICVWPHTRIIACLAYSISQLLFIVIRRFDLMFFTLFYSFQYTYNYWEQWGDIAYVLICMYALASEKFGSFASIKHHHHHRSLIKIIDDDTRWTFCVVFDHLLSDTMNSFRIIESEFSVAGRLLVNVAKVYC